MAAPSEGGAPTVGEVLERVAAGTLSVGEALDLLPLFQVAQLGEFARLDLGRRERKGVPEVVYAPRKTDRALAEIVACFLRERGFALASRVAAERATALRQALSAAALPPHELRLDAETGILEALTEGYRPPEHEGVVGIITAGTSDIPVAEEAALVMRHMGVGVQRAYDVGVAGVHRLLEPLGRMIAEEVAALVVVAGMEGALPSVVAGLVAVPVIGVPTSTGYGLGGDGTAALYSILQSCSPGLVAVNIDNGVGAGAAAALIARGGCLSGS
jgi:pyridinium-3,5-biscarboxylic acid mononucleotide synthase